MQNLTDAIANTQITANSLWDIRDFTSSSANQDVIEGQTEQQSATIESIGLGVREFSLTAPANDEMPTQIEKRTSNVRFSDFCVGEEQKERKSAG